jgi:hypothetical protein
VERFEEKKIAEVGAMNLLQRRRQLGMREKNIR